MDFKEWLELMGCYVEVTQEDDGSGYECWDVVLPGQTQANKFEITVRT